MSKHTKLVAITVTSLGLVLTGIMPANADSSPNLTYEEFTASDSYQDLAAASAASSEFISNQSGLRMSVTTSFSEGETTTPSGTVTIEATKSKMKLTINSEDSSYSTWIVDGYGYFSQSQYISTVGDVPSSLFSRIPDSKNKLVQSDKITGGGTLTTPDKLFSKEADSTLNQSLNPYMAVISLFTFSEVTKTVDSENPDSTSYEFDMSLDFLGQAAVIHEKVEFNGDYLNRVTITTQNGASAGKVVTEFEVDNEISVDMPDISTVITQSTIKKLTKQITAEGKLYPQATSIVKKATTLAKASKAAIAQKHLISAATALKLKITKINNGVKLTTKYQSVSGSV
ncbi:MAG: hypothetical protein EB055_05220, partial [Micrococcales bacterium]|nr:hypothetical protein [Micrococcales bacterium]